jgi:DNA polymerase III subunit alpha
MDKPFVHLHNHSDYSLLDGACKISGLVEQTAKMGLPAVALTDHGNMFGVIEFYKLACKAGVKPILGMEAYITLGNADSPAPQGAGKYNHLTLLAENIEGYRNLIRLTSFGYLKGFYYKPRISLDALAEHSRGLIALSGCAKGPVADMVYLGKPDQAREIAVRLRDLYGPENFFIEIMDHGLEIERLVLPELIKISGELEIPLVASNDTHYLLREHYESQDALVCIQTGKVLDDPKRLRFETRELYLKTPEEMYALFPDNPEALARTVQIAERCNVELEFDNNYLPAFPLPEGYSENQLLEEQARQGAVERYGSIVDDVEKRLRFELGIIKQTGFPGYFLIVSDFVNQAKRMGVPVGPGRGSAAGSLVSYCLGITNIDPLKYNLLFERFLNPERVSMPDIDIDFSDRDRDKVIQYVKDKYGQDNVAQIITFGTMKARAVVRDVGRVLGMPYSDVDIIAKMIPEELGVTLEGALQKRPELAEKAAKEPKIARLLNISKVLEGMNRHASTHAAGVIIAPGVLTDYVPLFRSTRTNDITSQYDMDCVQAIGLLKMDILGLRTLTVIQDALEMIEQRTGEKINFDQLELDDTETFRIFQVGDTVGIFQFESPGMREYLRKLKPEIIEDIIAMNALYRPGPLGAHMVDDFINRKHGKIKVRYPHPMLENILKETYGVIVYQEQVMQIASEMAGFTLGEADQLRRAMGKKKKEVMDQQKEKFHEGAGKKNVNSKEAAEVFDLMAHFAGYGFNKSHSAGYAILAYQTAYLKAHYPCEFMAATLTSEMNNTDRLAVFLEECRKMKIKVLPPDINESGVSFTVVDEGIRFGLAAIKNVGQKAAESIIEACKSEGKFSCLGDFLDRVDNGAVNRRLVESLIQSGATHSLTGEPEQLLAALEVTLDFCSRRAAERSSGQIGLFGESAEQENPSLVPEYPPLSDDFERWEPHQFLEFEKEYLRFYISGHPLDRFSEELDAFCNVTSAEFDELSPQSQSLRVGGVITQLRTFFDRKDREFAILTLEDRCGSVEVFVFSEAFERHREILYQGSFVLISGRLSRRSAEEQCKLTADWLMALDQVRSDEGVGVELRLVPDQTDSKLLKKIQETILRYRGNNPVYLLVEEPNGHYLLRSREMFAEPCDQLLKDLREHLGETNAHLKYYPRQVNQPAVTGLNNGGMHALIHGVPNGRSNGRGGRNGPGAGWRARQSNGERA